MASPFSGRAGRLAAMWGVDQAEASAKRIEDLIKTGKTDALTAINTGRTSGLTSLGKGYDLAVPEFQGAISRLDPWTTAGTGALKTYQDSMGLNGKAGHDATVATYRTSPGYERRVSEASDAAMRAASASGALGSGNTIAAVADRAQGLADEDYTRWQGQLQGLSDRGQQAAGTQAGIQTGLGNLYAQRGRDEASIYGTTAGQEAGIHQNFTGMGVSNLSNLGQQTIDLGTAGMMAGQNAASNRLNFGMNLANLGANLFGSYMGGARRPA